MFYRKRIQDLEDRLYALVKKVAKLERINRKNLIELQSKNKGKKVSIRHGLSYSDGVLTGVFEANEKINYVIDNDVITTGELTIDSEKKSEIRLSESEIKDVINSFSEWHNRMRNDIYRSITSDHIAFYLKKDQ